MIDGSTPYQRGWQQGQVTPKHLQEGQSTAQEWLETARENLHEALQDCQHLPSEDAAKHEEYAKGYYTRTIEDCKHLTEQGY